MEMEGRRHRGGGMTGRRLPRRQEKGRRSQIDRESGERGFTVRETNVREEGEAAGRRDGHVGGKRLWRKKRRETIRAAGEQRG